MNGPLGLKHWRRWLAAAGLAVTLFPLSAVSARADEDLAEGTLLVADKKLTDPNFEKTVVLIINYDDHGTVGLVVNRQGDVPVSTLLADTKAAKYRNDAAFSAGPVEPRSVLALLRARTGPKGAQHVAGDIWAILDQDLLESTLAGHAGPDRLRFYVGYAGWGPGQLEAEMDAGAWRAIHSNADTVFDATPETLWERVTRTMDLRVAGLLGLKAPVPLRSRS